MEDYEEFTSDEEEQDYLDNQDVSAEQLAGEMFQDKVDMYRNEY